MTLTLDKCGWPTQGGSPIGRTFHVVVTNQNIARLPLNPLYFTVETPDRQVRVAGVMPMGLGGDELQLVELRPGQTASGWLYFSVSPVVLARLLFDDGFGHTASIELNEYTLSDKTPCGAASHG